MGAGMAVVVVDGSGCGGGGVDDNETGKNVGGVIFGDIGPYEYNGRAAVAGIRM